CNGLFHIPLWQVFDVNVSFFLFLAAFQLVLLAFGLTVDVSGSDWSVAFVRLIVMLLWVLLPSAAILGYMIYGWLGGEQLGELSFVYQGITDRLGQGYERLAGLTGDFLHIITIKEAANGASTTSVDSDVLLRWTQIAAGVVAVLDFVFQ